MIRKFENLTKSLLSGVLLICCTLFTSVSTSVAIQENSSNDASNSMGIIIEESNDTLDSSNSSKIPDLGDDQAFPFIPGFGKNSGKD